MAKKNMRARKALPKSALPITRTAARTPQSPIYSLPDDLLEHIAFELKADRKFASLAALDQTCKRFSSVCKAILWQDVTVRSASYGTRLFSKKMASRRAMIGYLCIDVGDTAWFWKALSALCHSDRTRDAMVHAALPNIKILIEHSTVWPNDHIIVAGHDDKPPQPGDDLRIWISVRNHAKGSSNSSQTMEKVIATVLEFSDSQYHSAREYADEITSMPTFATRYDLTGTHVDRDVFLEYTRRVAAQSALISSMPPDMVETMYSGIFDAYKAGTLSTYPAAVKPFLDMTLKFVAEQTEPDGCLLHLDDLGTVALHLLLDKKSPDFEYDTVAVTYKLFRQMNRLFSTPANRECCGLMKFSVECETSDRAEKWIRRLLERHDPDSLQQSIDPPSVLVINLKEDLTPIKLFDIAWERLQKQFMDHFERLPVASTTDLPQRLVIKANYDERIHGNPIVEIDFSTSESRRMTVVGTLDFDDGMINKRFYRDGQLVKLSRED